MNAKLLTASHISIFLTKYYNYYENFDHLYTYAISGSLDQFEMILKKFKNSNSKYLGIILNYNYHWTLLFVIKKIMRCDFFYYNSFGNNLQTQYYNIIIKYFKNNFSYIYNTKIQQFDNYSCGVYVIIILLFLFFIIDKNILSLNKIQYIIETQPINNFVLLFKDKILKIIENEFYTERN